MARGLASGVAFVVLGTMLALEPARVHAVGAQPPCSTEAARVGWRAPGVRADGETALDFDGVVDRLAASRVVFVGESHDRFDHHLNQLEIICRLHAHNPDLAIAMEFFQTPSQPHLDAFVEGHIDEAAMLKASGYYERWRYDFRLYQPILHFARENDIPLVALNVPSEITRKVGRAGIANLSEQERAGLPVGLDQADEDYRARIKEAFDQHPERAQGDFETFLQVQLLWDEGMAEQVARYLEANGETRVVVLAGEGHVLRSGIPERLARRNPAAAAVVLQGGHSISLPEEGDFLLESEPLDLPAAGLMGVMLGDDTDGVSVAGFSEDSGAKAAGMQKGDRILAVDGQRVHGFADVKLSLLHKRPGDTVSVEIARPGEAASPASLVLDITLR